MFVSKQELITALGTFQNAAEKVYYAQMEKLFRPMNLPQNGDWLHGHKEKHQALQDYKLPSYNQVTPKRKTIYLQEFGKFDKPFIAKLIHFCEVFYPKMLVKCLPVLQFENQLGHISKRNNQFGKQYLAQDILAYMEKRVPNDAYCVMGITLKDIYPGQKWNFIYGWAKYKARVGIFSFLRWDNAFAWGETNEINWQLILYPSMRTMVHEIGHMFGITHCVYYRCLMSGYNNIEENYLNPMEFCPVCLRKIIKNIDFNHKQRYEGLVQFCIKSEVKQVKKDIILYEKLLDLNQKQTNIVNQSNKVKPPTNNNNKEVNEKPINQVKAPLNANKRVLIVKPTNVAKNRGKSLAVGAHKK